VDSLFGEGQVGLKVVLIVIVVLALLALAFWLVRRFAGGRLGGGAARGRQPRLAVIDQATVNGRRRLVLIRRDNVEHLLIIGGPTDVVVEQNIVRAATAVREPASTRPPAADTLPRAVPLGDDSMWPLQPEPAAKLEPASRVEPPLRAEPRLPRSPMASEEPMVWPGEHPSEPQAPAAAAPPGAPPTRERRTRLGDPLAELADELSRAPAVPEPTEQRRPPRLQPAPPAPEPKSAADQNLSEMAQRLEAALRRPAKTDDTRAAAGAPRTESAPDTPIAAPPFARPEPTLRRPFRSDDARGGALGAPKVPSEPAAPASDDGSRDAEGKPGQQKSFYDSLEQEMASLLNRPPQKP
jgi:flagellar biogenesis protein FliO